MVAADNMSEEAMRILQKIDLDKKNRALKAVIKLAEAAVDGNPNTDYSLGYVAACKRIVKAIDEELSK